MARRPALERAAKTPLVDKNRFIHGKSKPAVEADMVKCTYYIERKHFILLDRIRAKRLEAGAKPGDVDKSRLVREAIELLAKQEKV
jgi:hypothetical protein